jgi:hypothetical protein
MDCAESAINTKPTRGRFLFYKILTAVPVFTAILAIARYAEAAWMPFVYVGVCLIHAAIMYTIKCPHCAYYKLDHPTLRCFIWWGAPKIWKPRAGQEGRIVSIYGPIGILVVAFFPVYWLTFQWELLVVYFLSVAGLVGSIAMNECPRCAHFDCSLNSVPEEIRAAHRGDAA